MNGPEISSLLAAANAAANAAINDGKRGMQREAELNSARIEVVADKLALCAQSSGQPEETRSFFQLCLSLASELDMMAEKALLQIDEDFRGGKWPHVQRGIDYGVANNDIPEKASKLPPILKQVSRRKNEFFLQAAIMVLMISVKNACKMGWFTAKDTEELLTLANEVASHFSTMGEVNGEVSILPTVSSIMSRFYPQYKIGHVIASLEVKPGYGTYLLDFHISKNVPHAPLEKIRLFVAMKDNVDTSSCIVSPQNVNLLLNGRAVERRTNIFMDPGPQFPTAVNHLLKYGTNLLQAVGHFTGHYIILIAFMSIIPASSLPAPQDYVQPDPATLSSDSDSEIIEGPSRISLNCPITRIQKPVKGHLCKHYQCFDLSNYIELNSKRPSWRCPHCNQSVCFTDLRIDQRMAKILEEVGENVLEVVINADGSWTAASSNKRKYESHDKASADEQEQHEPPDSSVTDASCKLFDLTAEDDEMETADTDEPVDTKPVVHHNVRSQPLTSNLTPSQSPRSTIENHYSSALVANALRSGSLPSSSGSVNHNIRSEAQIGSSARLFQPVTFGMSPVLTDSVSPSLNLQTDNFQGNNYSTNSMAPGQFSTSNSSHVPEALYPQAVMSNDYGGARMIPRNVSRVPSAIQALAVQMPSPHQQHSRPAVSIPSANRSSIPLQSPLASNVHVGKILGSNIDRQRQPLVNPNIMPKMPPASLQNRSASRVGGLSTPNQSVNMRVPQMPQIPQTLSQPPHLRSSQVPNPIQQGVSRPGASNSPSTVERIQLMAQNPSQLRQPQITPLQTQTSQLRQPQTSSLQTQTPQMRQPQTTPLQTQIPQLRQPQTTPLQTQTSQTRQPQSTPLQTQASQTRQTQTTPLQTQAPQMRQPQITRLQTQAVRTMSSVPPSIGPRPPQAVTRTENLIDLPSDQDWQPSGRMRGSLTGQAYSAALSQYFGNVPQLTQPSGLRPPVSTAPQLSPQLQAVASRMNAQVPQVFNGPANNTSNGATGTWPPGP